PGDYRYRHDGTYCDRHIQPERNGRTTAWPGVCDSVAIELRCTWRKDSGGDSCDTRHCLVWNRQLDWGDGRCWNHTTVVRLRQCGVLFCPFSDFPDRARVLRDPNN